MGPLQGSSLSRSAVVSELFNVVLPGVEEAKDIDLAGFTVNAEYQQVIVNQRFAVSFSL
jgi:hypothetical protein